MANYVGYTLSNEFKVTDKEEFKKILKTIPRQEVIEIDEVSDNKMVFYCDGTIYLEDDANLISNIQKLLPDEETLIIKEIGKEKFRYFYSDAYIITNKNFKHINLDDIIEKYINNLKHVDDVAKECTNNFKKQIVSFE